MAIIKIVLVDEQCEISDKGDLAITIDDVVQNTYHVHTLPDRKHVLENMLTEAFEAGRKDKALEICKLLNIQQ